MNSKPGSFVYVIARCHYHKEFQTFPGKEKDKIFPVYYATFLFGRTNKNKNKSKTAWPIRLQMSSSAGCRFLRFCNALFAKTSVEKLCAIMDRDYSCYEDKDEAYRFVFDRITDSLRERTVSVQVNFCKVADQKGNPYFTIDTIRKAPKNFDDPKDFAWPDNYIPGCSTQEKVILEVPDFVPSSIKKGSPEEIARWIPDE
jgi:hypothetical protein